MRRRLVQVDPDTGETVEGFVACVVPRRKNAFVGGWLAMAQEPLVALAKSELEGADLRVLLMLLARLDFENLLVVPQVEVARELNMRPQHVSRSIKRLVDQGVLLRGPRVGISWSYRLNPSYGWKGSAKRHQEAMKERMRKAGISAVINGGVQGQRPCEDTPSARV